MSKHLRTSKDSPIRNTRTFSRRGILPDDLYDFAAPPARRSGRPPAHDLSAWTVTDDWPERVPVTDREVDVFEAWFGDILDELLGPI
jgi:hypothetical protein